MNNQEQDAKVESKTITITIKDDKVSKIIDDIPKDIFDCTLEKYILIGNMVINYASITESKETMKNTIALINADIFVPLKTEIACLGQQLNRIIPTIAVPSKKGNITQEAIFSDLTGHFMDDSFEDVSSIGKYSDIKASPAGYSGNVLIETKDYTVPVPTDQVDKFWRDMDIRDSRYGMFISMRINITKISGPLKIETRNGRTAVFIVNKDLDWKGHIFGYYIIRKMIELETVNRRNTTEDDLIKFISLINRKAVEIHKDMKTLDELINIIEDLKSANIRKLDSVRNRISEYKRNIETRINDMMDEIKKLEVN